MIHFQDGPAAGKSLYLCNAPLLLRVVIDGAGNVDALDLKEDEAGYDESIYVYLRQGKASGGIVCGGSPRRCRPFVSANYRLFAKQPGDDVARDNDRWIAWDLYERLILLQEAAK